MINKSILRHNKKEKKEKHTIQTLKTCQQQAVPTVLYWESVAECSVDVDTWSSSKLRRMSRSREIDPSLLTWDGVSESRDNLLADLEREVSLVSETLSSDVKEG